MTTDKKLGKLGLMKIVIPTVLTMILGSTQVSAQVGTSVYDNIPVPLPPNVPSLGYQATSTAEFGDHIGLARTDRRAGTVTVTMSNWALHSTYPTMDTAGYVHPITLNLYTVSSSMPPILGTQIATITQNFLIPWRPEADPTCGSGTTKWKASDGNCYNGYAFTIMFDLRTLNLTLPDQLIFGIAYNTNTWGYQPISQPGPYESLNVGLANAGGSGVPPYIGTDVEPDAVFWNTSYGPFYTDSGAGGVGIFRRDTGWTDLAPAVEFTAFTVATTKDDCKKDGWKSLSRNDGSSFRNQGDCVSWVNNPNPPPKKDGKKGPKAHLLSDD